MNIYKFRDLILEKLNDNQVTYNHKFDRVLTQH